MGVFEGEELDIFFLPETGGLGLRGLLVIKAATHPCRHALSSIQCFFKLGRLANCRFNAPRGLILWVKPQKTKKKHFTESS